MAAQSVSDGGLPQLGEDGQGSCGGRSGPSVLRLGRVPHQDNADGPANACETLCHAIFQTEGGDTACKGTRSALLSRKRDAK